MAATLIAYSISACNSGTGGDSGSNTSSPNRTSLNNTLSNSNNSTASTNSNTTNSNAASLQDSFLTEAAEGGMAEVELGKLASEKARNAEVKKFGQLMVEDHGKANVELRSMAGGKNVPLPSELSSEHASKLKELQGLSGSEFDKAYVDAMVEDHEKDVAAFKEQAESASDPELKAFAAKTLPTLQKHLEMIKGIQAKVNR